MHLLSSENLHSSLLDKPHAHDCLLLHHESVKVNDATLEESLNHKLSVVKNHENLDDSFLKEIQILNLLIFLLKHLSILFLFGAESIDDVIKEWLVFLQVLEVGDL